MKTIERTTHTPGPWRIGNAGKAIFPPQGIAMIADCAGCDNARANARLIAAAPDLLAALKVLHDAVDALYPGIMLPAELAIARAAIARAEEK